MKLQINFRGATMPTTSHAVQYHDAEPLKPVNDEFPTAGRVPPHPLFLLEVRNPVHVNRDLIARINAIMAENGFDVTVGPSRPEDAAPSPKQIISIAHTSAEMRGEARLVNWTQDGTLVSGSAVESAWSVRRQTVDAARERGEIFSVWVKGKHWYPGEALKLERRALKMINRALDNADPSSKLLFLLRKHGALHGKTPAEAVGGGMLDDVLRLATEWDRT
jgi:hypothetical protein